MRLNNTPWRLTQAPIPLLHNLTQLRKWHEVMHTPQLAAHCEMQQRVINSGTTYPRVITTQLLDTLRLRVPLAELHQISIAALVRYQDQWHDITALLLQETVINKEGLYSELEITWPRASEQNLKIGLGYVTEDNINLSAVQWLNLAVAITNGNGQVLFDEQGGMRFSLNVKAITGLEQAGDEPGWYQLEPLDEEDNFAYKKDQFMPLLKPLLPKPDTPAVATR